MHPAYIKGKGQGSAMVAGETIPESQREDNTQGVAHKRVDETQVVKDIKGGYPARKAEGSVYSIPAQFLLRLSLGEAEEGKSYSKEQLREGCLGHKHG